MFLTHEARPSQHRTARRGRCSLSLEKLEERALLSADAVLDWNAILLRANANDHGLAAPDQPGPTKTGRAFGMVHAAIYDAVNSIDRSYTPYVANVWWAPRFASQQAAAAQAAHDTLVALYPRQRATFDRELRASLRGIPLVPRLFGVAVGWYVAQHVLDWRTDDGSQLNPPYTPGMEPGQHRPDPLHPDQGFYGVGWRNVMPFAMESGSQFQVPPPPALTSDDYTAAYNEVKDYGAEDSKVRTEDQTIIGTYWGYDGTPGLGTPPRLYNQIARTLAAQQGNTMVENARLFALVNIAQADAGLASWTTKYTDNFWRPIIGVREGDTDGNPATVGDPEWRPLGAPCSNSCGAVTNFTPPFLAYTSGHATFGAASFRMLANFYGTDNIPFSFVSDEYNGVTRDQFGNVRPLVTRSYTSFSQAAEENGQSRIYLGIHWSFDKVYGIAQGNAIADYVFQHYLRPRDTGPTGGDDGTGSAIVSAITPARAAPVPVPAATVVATPVVTVPATEQRPVARDEVAQEPAALPSTAEHVDVLFGAPDAEFV